MTPDIANWRASVRRDADKLRNTIESNAEHMHEADVEDAFAHVERAVQAAYRDGPRRRAADAYPVRQEQIGVPVLRPVDEEDLRG